MNRQSILFRILILVLAGFLFFGCSRSRNPEQNAAVSAAEAGSEEDVRTETTPAAPQNPETRIVPSERRIRTQSGSAAFFAVNDMGFSGTVPDVFDSEIGRLRRRIPESLDVCLSNLGGSLPDEYLAPQWRAHLNRQSGLFSGAPEWYRLSAEGEGQGMNARFKAVWNDRMVIGFLRARIEPDGSYLLEDIGIYSTMEKPYSSMEIPPPLIDSVY